MSQESTEENLAAANQPAKPEEKEKHTSVARSAGIVSIAVMGSRVMGLVREMVFAKYFGAGFLMDAYQVGFRIPNTLRDLFAEGALSAAFVKTFTDYQTKRSEEEAWRLASMVFNALAIVLSIITILGIIFSKQIVSVIGLGYSPEKAALATTLTQIMFPFILFVAMAAVAMGVLNTKGRFGIPASASTAFNIVSIIAGLIFAFWLSGGGWTKFGKDEIPDSTAQWAIIGMAIGTLIGGAAQFLIQVPSMLKIGFRFRPIISFSDPGVRQVMRLMGPAIIGTSAVQIKVLVDTMILSGMDAAQSWVSYAFRLMQFPIGVFGVAIGTAAIPTLARYAAKDDIQNFRSTLSNSIGLVFLMTIPSACGLVFLGDPIIRLIYERGAFTPFDTQMVAWALAAYSIGLSGYAAIKVLSPSFYALDDAKTPMYVSIGSILIHAVTSYSMMRYFSTIGVTPERPNGFGHVGVSLATSIVALVNFLALVFFMKRKIRRIEGRRILSSLIRIILASAALSAASYFSYLWIHKMLNSNALFSRLTETFIPIAIGGTAFLIFAKLLKIKELDQFINAIAGRFLRSRAAKS